ncbi:phosphopantetheine-binding protein [Streptomyces sp. NPDC056039]|uniref:phosphopantetheine-binding protein n=1 Tax=Streptomyces sp. NPDC056039 TaxID=3345687 RepID=UPI0035DA1931
MRTAAVVVLRDDPTDAATARIDAYVVLSPGADPTTIRERAAGVLPDYMLPATDDLTMTLTEIWSDVLGVPVGPDDDLFELGGNSLFAVRITAAQPPAASHPCACACGSCTVTRRSANRWGFSGPWTVTGCPRRAPTPAHGAHTLQKSRLITPGNEYAATWRQPIMCV